MATTVDAATDLPAALRCAAAEVIIERGLGSFSLREVARRAQVSHAAPGYHFGDTRGLLTSLATEGLQCLAAETARRAATVDDPIAKLTQVGQGYVHIASTYPAHCEVIFRHDLIDPDDPELSAAGTAAIGVLDGVVRRIVDEHTPADVRAEIDVDDVVKLCWASMQGLVQIEPKLLRLDRGAGREEVDKHQLVDRFTSLILRGIVPLG